jgi:hypothetical protein
VTIFNQGGPAISQESTRQPLNPSWGENTVTALLFVAVALLVFFRIQDFDFFWHIANGKAMVEQHRIVNEEIFSFTRPGWHFSNHEWLAQIIFYIIFKNIGPLGVVVFKTVITVLVAFLLYRTARLKGADILWSGVLMALIVLEGLVRYRERPEIFSFLFLALMGHIMCGFAAGKVKKQFLYVIPFMFVLWDFLHGAVFGIIYLASFISGETFKHFLKRSEGPTPDVASGNISTLWLVGVTSLVALLINPYGIRSYDIFIELVRNNAMIASTFEFAPPPFKLFPEFWTLLFLVALFAIIFAKKNDITDLLVMTPFALLAIKYRRIVPFFGLVSVPVLATYLAAVTVKFPKARWFKGSGYILAALFVGYTVFIKFFAGDGPYSFGYEVNGRLLPIGSTRFINQSELTGNMYNPGHFGGYLAYYLYPRRRIFLYNHHVVFGDFPSKFSDPDLQSRYGIEYAVLDRLWSGNASDLNNIMQAGWALVFWDDVSLVVVKRSGANAPFVALHELRYFTPAVLEALENYDSRHSLLDGYESSPLPAIALAREVSACIKFYNNKLLADYLGYLLLRYQNNIGVSDALDSIEGALTWNSSSAYLWYAESRFCYRAGDAARAEHALKKSLSLDEALIHTLSNQMKW